MADRFLRNWNVKGEDVELEEKLAQGAEGQVWRGTLRGFEGPVAVKLFTGIASTWHAGKPVSWATLTLTLTVSSSDCEAWCRCGRKLR